MRSVIGLVRWRRDVVLPNRSYAGCCDDSGEPARLTPSTLVAHDDGDASALATLSNWSSMAQGAFSANTIRAWKADWEIFAESCGVYRLESLPASPKTVRAFVFECLGKGKKPATVRRYVSTIGRAHRARSRRTRGARRAPGRPSSSAEPHVAFVAARRGSRQRLTARAASP